MLFGPFLHAVAMATVLKCVHWITSVLNVSSNLIPCQNKLRTRWGWRGRWGAPRALERRCNTPQMSCFRKKEVSHAAGRLPSRYADYDGLDGTVFAWMWGPLGIKRYVKKNQISHLQLLLGSRPDATKDVLLLTDGLWNCGVDAQLAAEKLKQKANVYSLLIGHFTPVVNMANWHAS